MEKSLNIYRNFGDKEILLTLTLKELAEKIHQFFSFFLIFMLMSSSPGADDEATITSQSK